MTILVRIFTLIFTIFLISSCASIDYSPTNIAKEGSPKVHLTSGIFGDGSGGVFIQAINNITLGQPVPGKEVIAPAGDMTVKLYYFFGEWSSKTEIKHNFLPEKYYVIEAYPNFSERKITYKTKETTAAEFLSYQCATQRKIQKNLSGINPQKAPACEEKQP